MSLINQGVQQALAKAGLAKGKGGGKSGVPSPPTPELRRCDRCKGWHIPKLSKEACPNRISLKAGTLKQTLDSGKHCSYWVARLPDGTKRECEGEGHTWEDHKAALAEKGPPAGSGAKGGGGKGSKQKGDGKNNKEKGNEMREGEAAKSDDKGKADTVRHRLLT